MTLNHNLANTVMDSTENLLAYLAARWRDESQYEDIADYETKLRETVNAIEGVEFLAIQKRPFGFSWKGNDGATRITQIRRNRLETLRKAGN